MGAAPRTTPGTCALQGGILLWGPFCPTLTSKALTPLKNPVFWAQLRPDLILPPSPPPPPPSDSVCRLFRAPRRCMPSLIREDFSSQLLESLRSNKVVPDWLYCIFGGIGGNQSEINRMLEMSHFVPASSRGRTTYRTLL